MSGPAFGVHPAAFAGPSPGSPSHLGTLSECLFFFGIYSSHFGGTRKAHVFQFLEAATPSIPSNQKKKSKKRIPCRLPISLHPLRIPLIFTSFSPLPPPPGLRGFGARACAVCHPSTLRGGSLMRTAILPGMHLNPSDFRS